MNDELENNAGFGKAGPQKQGQAPKSTPPKQAPKKNKNPGKPQNNIANTDSDIPMTSSEVWDFFEGSDN
jgi:hypothetical protein